MKSTKAAILTIGLATSLLTSCQFTKGECGKKRCKGKNKQSQETPIAYNQLPTAVQSSVTKHVKGDISEIEKEIENGELTFEVETSGENGMLYFFSKEGKLLHKKSAEKERCHGDDKHDDEDDDEEEVSLTMAELPAVLQAAVKKHVKGEIDEIEREKEDGVYIYEVESEQDGEEVEYKFSADGKLLEVERD